MKNDILDYIIQAFDANDMRKAYNASINGKLIAYIPIEGKFYPMLITTSTYQGFSSVVMATELLDTPQSTNKKVLAMITCNALNENDAFARWYVNSAGKVMVRYEIAVRPANDPEIGTEVLEAFLIIFKYINDQFPTIREALQTD